MSIKRTTYKGLSFPDEDNYLQVRPAFTRICMENKPASKLLSVFMFKWDPGTEEELEEVDTFTLRLTQKEIVEAMCDEATSKTIHDAAMPCLHLFGYADVDESTYPFTYTVHLDRIREALSYCKRRLYEQLEKVLIVWASEKGLDTIEDEPLNKKNLYKALEKVLIVIRESSNLIGESSNSRRGRKPSAQAAADSKNEAPKNNKNVKNIKELSLVRGGKTSPSSSVRKRLPSTKQKIAKNAHPIAEETTQQELLVPSTSMPPVLCEPDMTGKWSDEKVVQYSEWCNKKQYTDIMRDEQLKAAKTLHEKYPRLTLEIYKQAFDERFDAWWKSEKKKLHVTDMKAKEPSSGVVRWISMIEKRANRLTPTNINEHRKSSQHPQHSDDPNVAATFGSQYILDALNDASEAALAAVL